MELLPDDPIVASLLRTGYPPGAREFSVFRFPFSGDGPGVRQAVLPPPMGKAAPPQRGGRDRGLD